jgi:hypothetical protein
MGKYNVRFIRSVIALICSIFICSCLLVEKQLKVEIPDASWPKIVFKSIDTAAELSSLKLLRESHLPEGDAEIRVWRGFGLASLEGVILKRTSGTWSAMHIVTSNADGITKTNTARLPLPQSGWDAFWEKLDGAGLRSLPDSSMVNCMESGADGVAYVVEINENSAYRTYMYQTNYSKCPQVDQIKEIGRIIAREFDDGKQECRKAEWIPCEGRPVTKKDK